MRYWLLPAAIQRDEPGIPAGRVNSGRTRTGPVTVDMLGMLGAFGRCAAAGDAMSAIPNKNDVVRKSVVMNDLVVA